MAYPRKKAIAKTIVMAQIAAENTQTSPHAKEYHRIKNFLFAANLFLSIGFLLFLIVTGLSQFLRAYLRLFVQQPWMLNAAYFAIFYCIVSVAGFPLDIYEGFMLEHSFGLSKQSLPGWLKDYAKKFFITAAVALIVVECAYAFLGRFQNSWWLFAALLWLAITVVFTKIFPVVILPLFFKSRPLSDSGMRARLSTLAGRFHFNISDILILELSRKTKKANAMVAGMGSTKRIYLSDTLLEDFSPEEIDAVVAHELAHDAHHDIYWHLFISFVVSMVVFYACDRAFASLIGYFGYIAKNDIASLPLLALLVLLASCVVLPFQNAFSRWVEARADRQAILATDGPQAFIAMMTKLGQKNLAEFMPSRLVEWFLYDHPPISKRIAAARASQEQ